MLVYRKVQKSEDPQNKKGRKTQINQPKQKYFVIIFQSSNLHGGRYFCILMEYRVNNVSQGNVQSVTLLKLNSFIRDELDNKIKNMLKTHVCQDNSSCLQVFFKIGLIKNFTEFTGKHLCWRPFLIKLQALVQ